MSPLDWGRGDRRRLSTRDVPRAVREMVTVRQGGYDCVYCLQLGDTASQGEQLELDHKQPLSKGGDNHHANLQWSCRRHNRSRQAKLIRDFEPR